MAEVVAKFGGYVAKYMGDGVLAYFGYPQAHEHDAEQAVRAGLALIDRVGRLESSASALASRVGIATGLVVVGDLIGSGEAQERGVVGETPNLAARLQEMAPANAVLVAESTRRLVGDLFDYHDLGAVALKGLAEPVPAWQVLGESTVENRFEALRSATLSPLVGRDEEVQLLLRRWARAKDGEGQIVLISGEAGIGKSRIAAALQERLEPERPIRLRYFCSPHRRDSALFPFIAQLERAAGFCSRGCRRGEARQAGGAAVPVGRQRDRRRGRIRRPVGGCRPGERYPPLPTDPRQKRELILSALVRQLEGAGAASACAVRLRGCALDRFDLARAAGAGRRARAALAGADGRDLPSGVRAALDRPGAGDLADIEPARPAGHQRRWSSAWPAASRCPPEILDRIIEHTDGIPLFIEELTKTLLEGSLLREAGRAICSLQPIADVGDPVEPA